MSSIQKVMKRTKAVSPVVAAILLIGLVVVAGAAIAFIVLPMLSQPPSLARITIGKLATGGTPAYSAGTLTFKLNIQNGNVVDVKISAIKIITDAGDLTNATVTPSSFASGGQTAQLSSFTVTGLTVSTIDVTGVEITFISAVDDSVIGTAISGTDFQFY